MMRSSPSSHDPAQGPGPLRVSNSFDYTPVRILDGFVLDPTTCSARNFRLHEARTSRLVLVAVSDRVVLCRTRTEDFDEAEIRSVVHDLGQLYLDISGKAQIDDFARDVRQLVVSDECRACPDFPTCVVCYRESPRSLFEQDEAFLRNHLRSLRGRVLDVGIGRGPYLEAVRDRLRSGEMVLHGLDPDPEVAEVLDGLTLLQGTIETFRPLDDEPYDHILAIRSLHHVADLHRAFAVMSDRLRPGGTLLLIESVALPLVRSRRHSAIARSQATGGFQHVRNWDSYRMLDLLGERYPFRVVHHRPISPDTCDQWILVLNRQEAVQVQIT